MVYETHRTNTKKRGTRLPTRSTYQGSGIALSVRTSNAEAHADMYISANPQPYNNGCKVCRKDNISTLGIYRCLVFDGYSNCQIQISQEQSVNIVNAFP